MIVVLGCVRTIAFTVVSLFVAVTLGVSCYPFDPLPVIGALFLILFALVGIDDFFRYLCHAAREALGTTCALPGSSWPALRRDAVAVLLHRSCRQCKAAVDGSACKTGECPSVFC